MRTDAHKPEYLKIVAPAVMAVFLFVLAVFGVFLPTYRQSLLNGKKDMIRELTRTAWSILAEMEEKERAGVMSRAQAQQAAIAAIRGIHYGKENKDYFWINDMRPYMIMHPFRPDLEGRDISDFSDPNDVHLFMDSVKTVQSSNEGFISYMWQWKDNPDHIVPKLSFVKAFAPWGWILGTGIYLEDVRQETALLTRRLLYASLAILALVSLLAGLLVFQSLQAARLRRKAEQELLEHQNQLENLIEKRTADLQQANARLLVDIAARQAAEEEKERLITELRQALEDIKTLQGIIPICAFCKQIRDDSGYWNQLEKYVTEHSHAEFSHAICPKCMAERYPGSEDDD